MNKQTLQQIANSLYLNIQYVNNVGLLDGATGCCLFLYSYARYSNNSLYSDLADELLGTIYNKLTLDFPLNFSDGLAGIAWSINYLEANNYIELEKDALEEVETVIYSMGTEQFQTDLESDIPLFSKGIYALHSTWDKELLSRIVTEADEFLMAFEIRNIPLSYLNSLIYFIIGCKEREIQTSSLHNLLEKIYDRLLISLKSNPYIEEEKRNLQHFIPFLLSVEGLITQKEKWQELRTLLKQESSPQQEIYFNWLDLLSGKNGLPDCAPEKEFKPDINKYVGTKIQHLTTKNLGLQDGLAGLGYYCKHLI